MRKFNIALIAGGSLAVGMLAGLLTGTAQSGPLLSFGLVNALNSVGQNLLDPDAAGFEVFAAHGEVLADGRDVLVIDLANTAAVPIYVDVFYPPDPNFPPDPFCRTTYRLSFDNGDVRVQTDPNAIGTRGLRFYGDEANLTDYPPDPCLGTPPTD